MVIVRPVTGAAPVGELPPAKVTQSVRMVEEPLLEDFLMQPRSIEPRFQTEFDIAAQRLIGRSGHHAVGPVALIQHEALKDGLAVDPDLLAFNRDGTQARVTLRAI